MYASMRWAVSGIDMMYPGLNHVSIDEFNQWRENQDTKKSLLVLDARPEQEYLISHLDESIHIDPSERIADVLDKLQLEDKKEVKEVVCYCSVGYRSSKFASRLQHALAKMEKDIRVHNLRGGIFQWATEQRPMLDGDGQSTTFVHPYSIVFSRMVDAQLRKWS